jgi:hypothetical protein
MLKKGMALVRFALDHPIGSLIVLSFVVMALVVGIERIEKGPPTILWMSRHHRSVALVKQVLCMTAIPGFLLLMFWDSKAKAKNGSAPP